MQVAATTSSSCRSVPFRDSRSSERHRRARQALLKRYACRATSTCGRSLPGCGGAQTLMEGDIHAQPALRPAPVSRPVFTNYPELSPLWIIAQRPEPRAPRDDTKTDVSRCLLRCVWQHDLAVGRQAGPELSPWTCAWIATTKFIKVKPPVATLTAALLELAQILFDGDADVDNGCQVETSASRIAAKPASIDVAPMAGRRKKMQTLRPGWATLRRSTLAEGTAPVRMNPPEVNSHGQGGQPPAAEPGSTVRSFDVETSHWHRPLRALSRDRSMTKGNCRARDDSVTEL